MTVHLYLSPAGGGKTTYVVAEARRAASGLQALPCICVASPLQRWSVSRRLAEGPGAIGVRTLLFDDLYEQILQQAGVSVTRLSDPVQYRLIRTLVVELELRYFARLVDQPGFVQVVQQLIAELKAARVEPAALALLVGNGSGRLPELALIYAAYQQRLQEQAWADRAGLGWMALEWLEREPTLGSDWSHLFVDGFDSFTVTQRAFLAGLVGRVGTLAITLTGEPAAPERVAHRRFVETRRQLEEALGVSAAPLPTDSPCQEPVLQHLERGLFQREATRLDSGGAVHLVAAADRPGEVREALRWLKEQHLQTQLPLHRFALLARDLDAYRTFIAQSAASYGLPIYAQDGPSLDQNPLVGALLALLRLVLPSELAHADSYALPRAGVVSAWRSPYFDWQNAVLPGSPEATLGIGEGDAERLNQAAVQGRVVGGTQQWMEALQLGPAPASGDVDDTAAPGSAGLRRKFEAFVKRIRPLKRATFRAHVSWLESLIGDDPRDEGPEIARPELSLQMVACLERGEATLASRDRAALLTLKEILRGLVVAEAALGASKPVSFAAFFQELAGAVEAAFVPAQGDPDGALVVSAIPQARGLPFAAVAVVGVAEGSFPASLREDPFLREEERSRLRAAGLPLESSVVSREREYFYETITHPWQQLLLVRGRLADDGAVWEPSPFWQELRRLVSVEPVELGSSQAPLPQRAANHAELLESLVGYGVEPLPFLAQAPELSERWHALERAAKVFTHRYKRRASPFDGDLRALAAQLSAHYGPRHLWSASQIETYLSCAHRFLCETALQLRAAPAGEFALEPAQLGAIYHQLLEQVYSAVAPADRCDAGKLVAALETVAPRVLDAAPARMGFRPAAWWAQTREEITASVAASLEALADLSDGYVPVAFERRFGSQQPLELHRNGERIQLRGVIDRIDCDEQGRLRVIDYKSAGHSRYTASALERGEHIQLPLYALAAEQALGLGKVGDGFYWSVRDAQASSLRLKAKNVQEMVGQAAAHTWSSVDRVRAGSFSPQPPAAGCPDYCAAAAFCWHYRPGFKR